MEALEPVYENSDEIPEDLRDRYVERDGVFLLNVKEKNGWALEEVTGLRQAHGRSKRESGKLKSRITELEQELEQALEKAGDGSVDEKAVEERVAKRFERKLAQILEENQSLASEVSTLLVEGDARQALVSSGADPDYFDLLLPKMRASAKVSTNDAGRRFAEITDAEGNPRYGRGGKPFTFEDVAKELKGKYPSAFRGTESSGMGRRPTQSSGSGAPGQPRHRGDFRSDEELSAFVTEHGEDAYWQLPPRPSGSP